MKKLITWIFVLITNFSFAQKNETYLKGNALFLPIGIVNLGIEKGFSEHITGQADLFISPWKSFAGKHAQIYMLGFNGRYYFDQAFNKFYLGLDFSVASFNVQKFNYWNDNYYAHKNGEPTPYIQSNLYQKGYSFVFGALAGYQFICNDRWNIDVFLGAGSMQSFYKGYDKISGERYDTEGDSMGRDTNRSGEFLPYKVGIMISYKL